MIISNQKNAFDIKIRYIVIIIIIKISDSSPSGKNRTFPKLQSNPTSTRATEKKTDAKEAD